MGEVGSSVVSSSMSLIAARSRVLQLWRRFLHRLGETQEHSQRGHLCSWKSNCSGDRGFGAEGSSGSCMVPMILDRDTLHMRGSQSSEGEKQRQAESSERDIHRYIITVFTREHSERAQ